MRLRVGSALKISIHADAGSGMTSMSEALIAFQPRMLEPSNPSPSVKISSLYSVSVVVKCCQEPGRSVNLKSTSFTSWSLIILLTSDAVFSLAMDVVQELKQWFAKSNEILKSQKANRETPPSSNTVKRGEGPN